MPPGHASVNPISVSAFGLSCLAFCLPARVALVPTIPETRNICSRLRPRKPLNFFNTRSIRPGHISPSSAVWGLTYIFVYETVRVIEPHLWKLSAASVNYFPARIDHRYTTGIYIATIVSVKPQAPTLAHSSRPRVLPYLAVPTIFKFAFFKNVVRAPPAYVRVAVGLGARCMRTLDGG